MLIGKDVRRISYSSRNNETKGKLSMTTEQIQKPQTEIDVLKTLREWASTNIPHDRPSWDETFIEMAREVAKRSPDAQTQVGAIIVDKNKHVLGVGYNGFMRGVNDLLIPNTRPYKYPFVIHAELNAIFNCEHKPHGATLYCTHHPCVHCFQCIVQAEIAELVYCDGTITHLSSNPETQMLLEIMKWLSKDKLTIRSVNV